MYNRILIPIDGSPTSNDGLDEGIKLARLTGASIRLIHVIDDVPFLMGASFGAVSGDVLGWLKSAGEALLVQGRKRAEAAGVPVDSTIYETLGGRLCERVETEAAAWRADLIVLGTHGRRGVGRMFLGSDAEQIVRTSTIPVLLVRSRSAGVALPPLPADRAFETRATVTDRPPREAGIT